LPGQTKSPEVVVPWWMSSTNGNAVAPADLVTRLPPIDAGTSSDKGAAATTTPPR
jgi:hypothetical protein